MKCTNCGQDVDEKFKFCSNCGQKLEKEEEVKVFVKNSLDKEESSKEDKAPQDTIVRGLDISKDIKEDFEKETIGGPIEEVYTDEELDETILIDNIEEYIDDDYDYDYEDMEDESILDKLKNSKWILGGVLAIIILLIGYTLISGGRAGSSKDELIDDFIEALVARDISDVRKMLNSPTPDLKIDSRGVEAFFKYIDENPSFIEQTKTELERQSKLYEDSKKDDIGSVNNNIVLKKKSKNEYFLEITPYYMNITVGAEGTKIMIEDKEVAVADRDNFSKEFGPFMPGRYKIGARYESDYSELESEKIVDLIRETPDSNKQIEELYLELNTKFVKIDTNYEEANIIVNGENIGKTVKELEDKSLGPIGEGTRVKLVLNSVFGEFYSEEISLDGTEDIVKMEILIEDDSIREEVALEVKKFIEDDMRAKSNLNMDSYTNLINPEKDKRSKLLEAMKEESYSIESQLKNIKIDLNSMSLTEHEGKYYMGADVAYEVRETYLWEFTTETNEDTKLLSIYLRFNESNNKWEVFETENLMEFSQANIKEYSY